MIKSIWKRVRPAAPIELKHLYATTTTGYWLMFCCNDPEWDTPPTLFVGTSTDFANATLAQRERDRPAGQWPNCELCVRGLRRFLVEDVNATLGTPR